MTHKQLVTLILIFTVFPLLFSCAHTRPELEESSCMQYVNSMKKQSNKMDKEFHNAFKTWNIKNRHFGNDIKKLRNAEKKFFFKLNDKKLNLYSKYKQANKDQNDAALVLVFRQIKIHFDHQELVEFLKITSESNRLWKEGKSLGKTLDKLDEKGKAIEAYNNRMLEFLDECSRIENRKRRWP